MNITEKLTEAGDLYYWNNHAIQMVAMSTRIPHVGFFCEKDTLLAPGDLWRSPADESFVDGQ